MNPFKWFNDLIERSALWYAVYVIALKYFFARFFGARSDEFMYTVCIITFTVFSYLALKLLLKLKKDKLNNYNIYLKILNIFYLIPIPCVMLFLLLYHPLLGTLLSMAVFFITGFAFIIYNKIQAKKQA